MVVLHVSAITANIRQNLYDIFLPLYVFVEILPDDGCNG
jgi:hypothetical protein